VIAGVPFQLLILRAGNPQRGIRMKTFYTAELSKSDRIPRLVKNLYEKMPVIESARAMLITESYRETEGQPIIIRRAKAFSHILDHLPIVIREDELIVGSTTLAPRGCQTYPEFSFAWLEDEFDTVAHRSADPFEISDEVKKQLREVHLYWKGKTTSELALAYMSPETVKAMDHDVFTPGNYFYNGVGHITVQYEKVLAIGFKGIREEAEIALKKCLLSDGDYATRSRFLQAVIISCDAAIRYGKRYADLAAQMAKAETNPVRQQELLHIAKVCKRVPGEGASTFWEACQSFWFVQQLLQIESSGHSISPGRFDQYMYPYYQSDLEAGRMTRLQAQELIDCIWVKLNDLNKCRDATSAEGFAGYSMFQNLVVGGQDKEGQDVTNDLSFMCITASAHVFLPQPSLSVRVWNGTPYALLQKAASLTKTGIGFPAYYNDEVIIPSLMNRGLTLADARDYDIIGCVEPQKAGKTEGWHDAAFFNMCRPLEMVFTGGYDRGELLGVATKPIGEMQSYEEFFQAYQEQMNYFITLLVNADNCIDAAHSALCPLPFESSMVEDCIGRGKSLQEGGAVYNFTGPQGFGVANVGDSLYVVKKLVFEEHKLTLPQLYKAMLLNFGQGLDTASLTTLTLEVLDGLRKQGIAVGTKEAKQAAAQVSSMQVTEAEQQELERIWEMVLDVPKYGNDVEEADAFAREAAYTYSKPLQNFRNPRGGVFQAGLYPVSANVPLGAVTGATPDGRLAHMPVADGVSPTAGRDVHGPTATANSVARLDHGIASNGTLLNQKFHPTALSGEQGMHSFIALIRSYFDQKGSHVQFNVVDRATLLDAQVHPENYQSLVVRVAGYSALFTTLSRSLQDDIIRRTEQGF
jgi:formate C-acetyltransferase